MFSKKKERTQLNLSTVSAHSSRDVFRNKNFTKRIRYRPKQTIWGNFVVFGRFGNATELSVTVAILLLKERILLGLKNSPFELGLEAGDIDRARLNENKIELNKKSLRTSYSQRKMREYSEISQLL